MPIKSTRLWLKTKNGIDSIVQETGFSIDTIHTIVRTHLFMSKVCARWLPKMLIPETKQASAMIGIALLIWYYADTDLFHSYLVKGDEAWAPYHEPVWIHGMEACWFS